MFTSPVRVIAWTGSMGITEGCENHGDVIIRSMIASSRRIAYADPHVRSRHRALRSGPGAGVAEACAVVPEHPLDRPPARGRPPGGPRVGEQLAAHACVARQPPAHHGRPASPVP